MADLNSVAEDLFNKIRGRFPSLTIGDENGSIINTPESARFFDFDCKIDGVDLGKVSISLDDNTVSVIVAKDITADQPDSISNQWYNFLKELRMFAKKRMMQFDVRDINKSNLKKSDYQFLAANRTGEDNMNESSMYGTAQTSYQRIGNARLAIKHFAPINTESVTGRVHRIGTIFIESPTGERFRYPTTHLNGARALARHVSEGGYPYDDFGKYITGLSEEYSKLRKFSNYMNKSSVMAETLDEYSGAIKERISEVKKTIANLQKESFYKTALESFVPTELETVPNDIAENWIEQLTIKQFNEELQDVFPYIYKLVSEITKVKELGPEDLLGEESELQKAFINSVQSKLKKSKSLRDPNAKTARDEDRLAKQLASKSKIKDESKDPCWKGYHMVGMKKKGGKEVPNCVPESNPVMGYSDHDVDSESPLTNTEQKTPVSEFILSFFDRNTGKFPKGETAVLTAVQKDYGDQYVKPAAEFMKKVEQRTNEILSIHHNHNSEMDGIKKLAGL